MLGTSIKISRPSVFLRTMRHLENTKVTGGKLVKTAFLQNVFKSPMFSLMTAYVFFMINIMSIFDKFFTSNLKYQYVLSRLLIVPMKIEVN